MVTKHGVFEKASTLTQAQVDAGVTLAPYVEQFIEAGDLAELTCLSDEFATKLPQTDLLDDDPKDDTITAFCMSPQSASLNGR